MAREIFVSKIDNTVWGGGGGRFRLAMAYSSDERELCTFSASDGQTYARKLGERENLEDKEKTN